MVPPPQTAAVTLRLARTFAASRDRVFRAWTEPAALKRWFAPGDLTTPVAEVDLRVGGQYRVHMQAPDGTMHQLRGTYRQIDPPRKLVFTWSWETHAGATETLVTVEFFDRGGSTEVVLTHERLPSADERDRHEHGWDGCLTKLARELPTL